LTVLTVIAIGLAIFFYSLKCLDAPITPAYRRMLSVCRLLFLGLLLYLMTRPFVTETVREPVSPVLYIALDDSRSMSFPVDPTRKETGNPQSSRWERTIQRLTQDGIIDLWEKRNYRLRYTLFSDASNPPSSDTLWSSALPLSATPTFDRTNIGTPIARFTQTRDRDEESCLLLFTDGQWNAGQSPVSAAASLNADARGEDYPASLYTFGIGTVNTVFDIILDRAQLPHTARAEEPLTLRVHLLVRGNPPSTPITLRVRGESLDNEQIYFEEKDVTLPSQNFGTFVEFDLPSLKIGEYTFSVEAVPSPGELMDENNRLVRGIRIREAQDRVLMLTSGPDFEFKLLKRILEDSETIDSVSYLKHENGLTRLGDRQWIARQNTPSNSQPEQPVIPSLDELSETLDRWAVVILHNMDFDDNDAVFAQRLNDYTANGGGVLFIPGSYNKQAIPLNISEALPSPIARIFVPEYRHVALKDGDAGYSTFFGGLETALPPLLHFYRIRPRPVSGKGLLQGQTPQSEVVPLVSQHRYGLGRIVVMSANSFWRWPMLTGKDILTPFWLTVLYQCRPRMRSGEGQLTTNGFLYETLESVHVTYTAGETVQYATRSGVPATVQGPSHRESLWLTPSQSSADRFEADYTPTEPGDYAIATDTSDAMVSFQVENAQTETTELRQNIEDLRAIAKAGGGEYANAPAWKQLAANLPVSQQIRIEQRTRFLGEKWWMASVMILFLALEWFLRWRRGLP